MNFNELFSVPFNGHPHGCFVEAFQLLPTDKSEVERAPIILAAADKAVAIAPGIRTVPLSSEQVQALADLHAETAAALKPSAHTETPEEPPAA
jgi:hypothetical protein